MPAREVAVIGAGVTGAAVLHVLARYTGVQTIDILEKYPAVAQVNSKSTANSQTLHFGDIETNYSAAKAAKVKRASARVARYLDRCGRTDIHQRYSKMVLGVGAAEVQALERRAQALKDLFPDLRLIGREEIGRLEPEVLKGRASGEEVAALATPDGYAVDFGLLSESFVQDARSAGKDIREFFGTTVRKIVKRENFIITADTVEIEAKTVVFAAGGFSLVFARSLGYGFQYAILPVAGNFFVSPKVLNGKVYTVQDDRLPFAAVHGDPDNNDAEVTRFGPTAQVLPLIEREDWSSFWGFIKSTDWDPAMIATLAGLAADPVMRGFALKNLVYGLPWAGRRLFAREVRKIIPALEPSALKPSPGLGGIRPQLLDKRTRSLCMGEAEIVGDRIIFDITPSPGASVCLENAEDDAKRIAAWLGKPFDAPAFNADYP